MSRAMNEVNPRGDCRIVYHADGHPWEIHIPLEPRGEEDLHEFVDNLSVGGVDVMSLMGLVGGDVVWTSDLATLRYSKHPPHEPARLRLARLLAQGIEPIDAYARRCHQKGMKLYVKFRMNDRHSCGKLPGQHHNIHMGRFIQEHQEWWLQDNPGGLDFTHAGVRAWMFALAQEVTTKFDIDGLTFNYIRYPYVFERAESREKQPILTEFMRRVRGMLDEEGRKKGRKLDFCVIVAPTIEECQDFGLDVPTWIDEEIVDSVCPCHYDNTLFNTSFSEFPALARGKNVYVYPAIHPSISPYLYVFGYMTPPTYRAAARNIYEGGADGISIFNYHLGWQGMETLWGAGSNNGKESYPRILSYLKGLRAPDDLGKEDRHYVYWRTRDLSYDGDRWHDRHSVMTLARSKGARAEWPIHCAEAFDGAGKALVRLNAVNLLPGDEIEISVNGAVIAPDDITRVFHAQGRTDLQEGMFLPAYTTVTFEATAPPFSCPDNRLGLLLDRSAQQGFGEISVAEIEIAVSAGSADPAAIMEELKDGPYPEPMETLAGYHPATSTIAAGIMCGDTLDSEFIGARPVGDGSKEASMGVQYFVLPEKAEVSCADLCIYRVPEIQESLRLSLRADVGGVPADAPVTSDAAVDFDPWATPEGLLVYQLQGYYRFAFDGPLSLNPGTYWLVLEMDPARQPASSLRWGDPASPSCYAPALAVSATKQYPQGRYMTRTGGQWREATLAGRPVSAFFGVFSAERGT